MDTASIQSVEDRLRVAQSESLDVNLSRWHVFAGSPSWLELQALKIRGDRSAFTVSRYAHADTVATASRLATIADKWACPAVYLIANPIDEAVATRDVPGQWRDMAKGESTTDNEIAARMVLYIDVDAVRVKGTSATGAELAYAARVGADVYDELTGILEGDSALGYGHSGNGRAVLIALDGLPVVEAGQRHEAILIALAARYTSAHATIDRSVHDAKRLIPCWGTIKRKGAPDVPTRPHRKTAFVCPDDVSRLSMFSLDMLVTTLRYNLPDETQRLIDRALGVKGAGHVPGTQLPRASTSTQHVQADTQALFRRANECPVLDVLSWLGLASGDVATCPGCGLSDSGVAVVGNGLKCSHNRCQDKGYADGFRTIVDLVAEVRGCKPIEAVRELGERFGFEVPKPKTAANQNQVGEVDSGSVPDSFYDSLYGVDADDKSPVKKPVNENGNQAGTKQENGPEPKPVEDPMKAWVTVMTVADLFEPEPKANLVIPALGIAPGPPHGWVGEGYVGKTITALSMGLCVAAGLPVWNLYPVVKGRWLHIDHEQGRRVTKKRIIRLMLGMGIATDMIVTSFGFAVYPKLNLTTKNAEDLYCRLLDGWQMATFDALKGLTPGVDENSSEIRDYMAKLSRASEKTGCSVVLIHHGGKPDAKAPKARKNMGRGSSGIFDECQSYFVATANKGEPVIVSHEKTRELDTPVDNFELRIEDVTINEREGAGLRVVHDTAEPGDEPAVNASLAQVCERVVQAVMCAPGASSRELALTVRAKKETLYAALDQLARKGRIVNTGTRASASWRAK